MHSPATALVVGVTSHRDLDPAQLPELTRQVRTAISELRNQFPELLLIVLSPLAEGGDRLVAEVALELGARLIVPLPLPVELYAQDFATAQSREQFDRLLGQAEVVPLAVATGRSGPLRQPGPLRDRQYLLAGLYVASHCHVLLALWDGARRWRARRHRADRALLPGRAAAGCAARQRQPSADAGGRRRQPGAAPAGTARIEAAPTTAIPSNRHG